MKTVYPTQPAKDFDEWIQWIRDELKRMQDS